MIQLGFGFGDVAVGAMDGVGTGGVIPIGTLGNSFPLSHCAGISDARQAFTSQEHLIANARYAVGDSDTRQASTSAERPIHNARHAAIGRNNTIHAPAYQCFTCRFNQAITRTMIHLVIFVNRDAR